MIELNLKSWNETEGRIRFYKVSIRKNGKKCNHYVFVKDIKKAMPKKYETFQKQIFRNGKWENLGGIA